MANKATKKNKMVQVRQSDLKRLLREVANVILEKAGTEGGNFYKKETAEAV